MDFRTFELLTWARQHERDEWTTLVKKLPFRYTVTAAGIEYTPASGKPRHVPQSELASFCAEFQKRGSYAPGHYPDRWHKSYTVPIIQRFLQDR